MAIKRDLLVDKLFDKKLYNTMYISKADEDKARQDQVDMVVELLCDERHKASKQAVYNFIKKEPKAVETLMLAISQAKGDKKALVSACWEGNIDCTPYLPFFAAMVVTDPYEVAMEALTVVEHMTGEVKPALATEIIGKVKEGYKLVSEDPKSVLILDLVQLLHRWE